MNNNSMIITLIKDLTDEQKDIFMQLYALKQKSTTSAYLLLIFLGMFGIHKFYLKNNIGWIYLALTCTMIGSFISGLLTFIDLFTLSKKVEEYNLNKAQSIVNLLKTYEDPSAVFIAANTI